MLKFQRYLCQYLSKRARRYAFNKCIAVSFGRLDGAVEAQEANVFRVASFSRLRDMLIGKFKFRSA